MPARTLTPPSLEEVMADQQDLDALCAPRPLVTSELFEPNAYYGHDQIVKAYAEIPLDRPLKIVLPHAVECHTWTHMARREDVPVTVFYADGRDRDYRRLGVKVVWPLASPWLHLLELQTAEAEPARGSGTLFFVTHGSDTEPVPYDGAALARRLVELPAAKQPVTVCMYHADYNRGFAAPFRRAGLRIVSAGHTHDWRFLFRLRHLLSLHRFAGGNDFGSHVFYAAKVGCEYFHLDTPLDYAAVTTVPIDDPLRRATIELARRLESMDAEARRQAVDPWLGASHLLPPQDLRDLLARAERLDRVGICRAPAVAGGRLTWTGPWSMRRRAARLVRRLRRARQRGAS